MNDFEALKGQAEEVGLEFRPLQNGGLCGWNWEIKFSKTGWLCGSIQDCATATSARYTAKAARGLTTYVSAAFVVHRLAPLVWPGTSALGCGRRWRPRSRPSSPRRSRSARRVGVSVSYPLARDTVAVNTTESW
jgi:hypothetical protein